MAQRAPQSPRRRRSKYHSRRITYQGDTFDSQGELARWLQLQAMQQAGEITDLERQINLTLQPGFVDNQGQRHLPIRLVIDFAYTDARTQVWVLEDFKGFQTADSKNKMKMLRFLVRDRPDIRVQLSHKSDTRAA